MFEQDQQIVNELLEGDSTFRRLHDQHHVLKEKVKSAEIGIEPMDDLALGSIKKEKLLTKDRMAAMIEEYRQSHA